jgi:hypothetical protein
MSCGSLFAWFVADCVGGGRLEGVVVDCVLEGVRSVMAALLFQ